MSKLPDEIHRIVSGETSPPPISVVDTRRARLTDAVPEVAKAHGALTVVVSHDQIIDQGVHEHSAAGRRLGECCAERHAHRR